MGLGCFTYMLLFIVYFPLLFINFLVLANSNLPSLQQSKPLCHDQEKIALLHFKQSFRLDCSVSNPTLVKSWHNESDVHHSKNATVIGDCCRWDGVKCNEETGHVIGLDLSSSCLYGTFPQNSTLFSLSHLRELDLSYNNFNYSQIPSDIGRLYKLTHLNLSDSVLSGEIPLEISKLSSLSLLDLSYNGGPIGVNEKLNLKLNDLSLEKLVNNLSRLTHFYLDFVDISSEVPPILSNRTSLKAISLGFCNLLGEFPTSVFRLPKLEEISLINNPNLKGYLPEFHSNSPLRVLVLQNIKFSGDLPDSLGNLASLSVLNLYDCEFSGKIPSSIGNLTDLTILGLAYNYFSELPYSIMNLTRLTSLFLSNMMDVRTARILKSWLPKLNSLTKLFLPQMHLGNDILPTLSNLTRLDFLILQNNLLTGPLPSWFMNLTQLEVGNQLQGPIPPWISNLISLQLLNLNFRGTAGKLDPFFMLPNLRVLILSGVSLTFPQNISTNSSILKLHTLGLKSCNLTEFPKFLRYQDELRGLFLQGNNITGNIPQWLVNTTRENLLFLYLSNNLLTGFEQPLIFLPWNNLKALDLNDNKLRGPLPMPPRSMLVYQVSYNQFHGVLPHHICRATSLVYLDLSENSLVGEIPSCIGHQLSGSLQVLNARGNQFGGAIPPTFSKSCKLKMINLSQNQFVGNLPKSLINCTLLEVLDVGSNRINDTFPSWLGSIPTLQVLIMRHNYIYGKITTPFPSSVGNDFHGLRIIDLSYNYLTGNLPSGYFQSWVAMTLSTENSSNSSSSFFQMYFLYDYGQIWSFDERYNYVVTITNKGSETTYPKILTVLRVIDLSSNKFTGRIPKDIGNLRGLQALNLSNNNLVGGIPSSLANITDLESLDLSENMLSGLIPRELTRLTFLGVFNVSQNRLVGSIPKGEQFNTFDNNSFAGNSALCGAPLSTKCKKDYMPSSPPQKSTNDEIVEEDTKLIDWIIRSLGCVSGFIIGYVIGKIYVTDRHHDWFMKTFGRKGRSKTRVKRSTQRVRRN
ncbi:receptor like protein 30-like [Chenopodium quinoa]|uniref:receptor like protein 30-like n=1 Tax=Chenopodium quinoa TaxID=63459 RepID=UPI000B77F1A0|nr:receptor like protein 30-like [Chenopodium quinoa]